MKRFLSIIVLILTLLFVAFIIQNAELVELTFLAWSIEISKALLMMICAALGFLIGLVAFSFSKKPQSNNPAQETMITHEPSAENDSQIR